MMKKKSPSQYAVYYMGTVIEYTGYFASPAKCRAYLKARYAGNGFGLRFRASYPVREEKFYIV